MKSSKNLRVTAPPSTFTNAEKFAAPSNPAAKDLSFGKIVRSLVGIAVRSAEAVVRRNSEHLCRERALLANLLLHGTKMRKERIGVALYSLRGEIESISFLRDDIRWNALGRCAIITPALLTEGDWQIKDMMSLLNWLRAHGKLSDKQYFVDVGANIGTSCIPLALNSPLAGIAIEPVSDNFTLLQRNIVDNHLEDRITAIRKAVSKNPGAVVMIQDEKNSGGAEVKTISGVQGFGSGSIRPETVEADRLETILGSRQIPLHRIAFVWSDTQGFEHEVLGSAESLWRVGIPLYVEVWPKGLTLHQGRNEFLRLVAEHFTYFLPSSELTKLGNSAKPQPISDFTYFFEGLLGNGEDVLFLK